MMRPPHGRAASPLATPRGPRPAGLAEAFGTPPHLRRRVSEGGYMGALDGKVILVTGGGRGIGRATALLAASEGASVVVADNGCEPDGTGSNPAIAKAVVDEITSKGGKAQAVTVDLSTMAGGEEAVRTALDGYGRLDGLVTSAGVRRDTPIWEMDEDDWDAVVNGNAKTAFTVTKLASIAMRQQRTGRIVMMTSDAGLGAVGASNYAAGRTPPASRRAVLGRDGAHRDPVPDAELGGHRPPGRPAERRADGGLPAHGRRRERERPAVRRPRWRGVPVQLPVDRPADPVVRPPVHHGRDGRADAAHPCERRHQPAAPLTRPDSTPTGD
ncbi:MAG: hypothetical protein CVU47_04310 [Chloroflexi bacterium HGW-Chloroflexi-9]|nr:MAG: hypothetical protein CVU47_04310 [Chloroflexi bacterium HGW-Chloroflexi-9]